MEESAYSIGYLGPKGTFSEDALLFYLDGREVETKEFPNNQAVLAALLSGEVNEIIVAYRNTLSGPVFDTLYWLVRNPTIKILGQLTLKINQNLITVNGPSPAIQLVFTHEAAKGQCLENLAEFYPKAKVYTVGSTALAVKDLEELAKGVTNPAKNRPYDARFAAAIASKRAADVYKRSVVRENFQDHDRNLTSFWVLSRRSNRFEVGVDYRSTFVFLGVESINEFYEIVVQGFHNSGIKLTWQEVRPARKSIDNFFYMLEVEGHEDDERVKSALESIARRKPRIRIHRHGSYPESTTYESS